MKFLAQINQKRLDIMTENSIGSSDKMSSSGNSKSSNSGSSSRSSNSGSGSLSSGINQ